jgi:hypothetical protein
VIYYKNKQQGVKNMAQYEVLVSTTNYLHTFIEAENQEEADKIAASIDGGDFEDLGESSWNIEEVRRVK